MTLRIPKLKKYDPVYVEWVDAFEVDGAWSDIENLTKTLQPYTVMTLGYYITTIKDTLIFANGYEKLYSERATGVHGIPIGCITKIKRMKP